MSFWSSRARQPAPAAAAAAPATAASAAAQPAKPQPPLRQQPASAATGAVYPIEQPHGAHAARYGGTQPEQYRAQPHAADSGADVQYQLEQYDDRYQYDRQQHQRQYQTHQQESQHLDQQSTQPDEQYASEYDDGYGDDYAAEHRDQQQDDPQQQWDEQGHGADEQQLYYDQRQSHHDPFGAAEAAEATDNGYGDAQYESQYDEYGQGETDEEQWMDEQQVSSAEDEQQRQHQHQRQQQQQLYQPEEQAVYDDEHEHSHDQLEGDVYDDEAGAEYEEQAAPVSSTAGAQLSRLHSLPSHSHPLHPVQESENEPTSPEMNASALPSDRTLSSTIANIHVDRAHQQQQQQPQQQARDQQQPASPSSAASSVQSPSTPSLMALSPSSAARQRYIEYVDLLALYCRQTTLTDDTTQAALRLVDGLRHRYNAFAASSSAAASALAASGTEMVAAMLRFMQSSLTPMQLQPLLHHAGTQVVQHLSLALSSVGCVALTSSPPASSCQLLLASSLLQSRLDALRLAFRARSYSQPLLYVSPHHAADIEQLAFALSLPPSCFFVVPTVPYPHSPSAVSAVYTMDASHLHALLSRHRKEKRHSAALLLTVGSLCSLHSCSSGYQLDDVHQLTAVAEQFGLWVHAEGSQIIESEQQQQRDYQQHQLEDEGERNESGMNNTAQTELDSRTWTERYSELVSGRAGVLTFVPSRVHSISLHANDYFTLPDTLAFTILTPNAGLDDSQLPQASLINRAAVSASAASVLSLWSQLLAVSSRSFSALLALFPALLTLSHAKLDAAKEALHSFEGSLILSPAEYATLAAPPFLFFSVALTPPFNHSFFHLTAAQANELLAQSLLRRGDSDAELCALLCSPSLSPSASLFSHTGFLYSSFTPCPAAVDSVERHTAAFHHFLDCLQAELAVVAACGALMPALQSLLSNEADFQLVAPSALSASTRPGLCAFRFTPSAIPPSFHNELTKALLADLVAALPTLFRGGECDVAGSADGSGTGGGGGEGNCGAAVIVVELCEAVVERGVQSLVRTVHKLSKRVRLPSHVESALSSDLKRSIEATEAQLKAGQAASGGVIRNIPIVGSFFSFFAGGASKKGHSYDINSSYTRAAGSAQQPHATHHDASKQSTAANSSGTASGSGSGKQTPLVKLSPTPSTPPVAPQQPRQARPAVSHTTDEAADDEESGVFSRGASAALPNDSDPRYNQTEHELSMEDEQQQQQEMLHYTGDQSHSDTSAVPAVHEQQLFDQLSSRDPADLHAYISDGTVLTIFFPADPAQPDSPSSAIPLYLFYDYNSASLCWCEPGARYVVAEQTLPIAAIAELHLGNANAAFPADADESRCFSIVSDLIQLHCEEQDAARRDEIVLALYSLLSYAQGEQEEERSVDDQRPAQSQPAQSRHEQQQLQQQEVVSDSGSHAARPRNGSGGGAPLSKEPTVVPPPPPQQQQQQQQSRGAISNSSVSEAHAVHGRSAHNGPGPGAVKAGPPTAVVGPAIATATATAEASSAAKRIKEPIAASSSAASLAGSSAPSKAATDSMSVSRALSLLEGGSAFTVFLVDRSQPQLTSRHPVVLWWIPDSAAGKGRLCWSRRSASGATRLEYHPSRSLLLSAAVELSLGKQTKALCNAGMDDVDAARCVSVMVDRTVLNLAADSEADRDEWLAALHTVMIHGNKKLTTLADQ